MKGVGVVIVDLREAEEHLHLQLQRVGERHCADPDVTHVVRDLARWSAEHVARLAAEGRRFGIDLGAEARSTNPVAAGVRRRSSELIGRRQMSAVLLVNDLRQVHADASLVLLDWQLLARLARAERDPALLDLAQSCSAETRRQVEWAQTKLEESVVQALATP